MDVSKTKYQWLYARTDNYEYLHYIESVLDWGEETWELYESQFNGERPWTSICGLNDFYGLPGVLSRLAAPRCSQCCKIIDIPNGNGCPINDNEY